jgi:O-antigen ligase
MAGANASLKPATKAAFSGDAKPRDWPQLAMFAGIALALLGTAWAIDPFAEAAFDAPKRLALSLGALLGGLGLVFESRREGTWSKPARWIALGAASTLAAMLLAAAVAPQRAAALDAMRFVLLCAVFMPLGASRALEARGGRVVLVVASFAIAINAMLSLMQRAGTALPLPISRLGGRFDSGALLGNEGYVALACALLAAACLALAIRAPKLRFAAIGVGLLALVTIAANHQLTSAIAVAGAIAAMLALHWRAQRLVAAGALALALMSATVTIAPWRDAIWTPITGIDHARWQQATTYRTSAWAAAERMIAARPMLGHGAGSFAAQSQHFRLEAEIVAHERFPVPPNATSFVHVHNDYLQLAAEAGLPALALALATFVGLMTLLAQRASAVREAEPLLLFGVLAVGAVAALAWFPLQIPLTAIVLLLAGGRAWRIVSRPESAA